MSKIKKVVIAVAIIAGILLVLSADAKFGESACEGEGKFDQTTGECVE